MAITWVTVLVSGRAVALTPHYFPSLSDAVQWAKFHAYEMGLAWDEERLEAVDGEEENYWIRLDGIIRENHERPV